MMSTMHRIVASWSSEEEREKSRVPELSRNQVASNAEASLRFLPEKLLWKACYINEARE
jgi:hypothetical protein